MVTIDPVPYTESVIICYKMSFGKSEYDCTVLVGPKRAIAKKLKCKYVHIFFTFLKQKLYRKISQEEVK